MRHLHSVNAKYVCQFNLAINTPPPPLFVVYPSILRPLWSSRHLSIRSPPRFSSVCPVWGSSGEQVGEHGWAEKWARLPHQLD